MDDTILSGDLKLSAHVAVPEPAGAEPRPRAVPRSAQPAAWRGDGRHHLSRPRRPHRQRSRLDRAHVQLPRHRDVGGRLLRARLARRPARRGARAARARRRARRVGRGLRSRRNVRGVRSRRRPPRARGGDDRGAEHAARLGAGSRPAARARAFDGHDPQRRASRPTRPAGCATSVASTRSRPRRASTVVRSSCCTAWRTPRCRSRTPGRSPTPVGPTRSCGSCRAPGTGCATTRARSPRCSAGSPARCRAGTDRVDRRAASSLSRRGRASSTASRVSSRSCSGCQPVAATSLAGRRRAPARRPVARDRSAVTTRSGRRARRDAVARRRRRRARRAPSTRCRPRPATPCSASSA